MFKKFLDHSRDVRYIGIKNTAVLTVTVLYTVGLLNTPEYHQRYWLPARRCANASISCRRVSVHPSVTRRTRTAKYSITQTTPYDNRGSL